MAMEIKCPVCTVPVEVADRFCCDTGTCPARGYRPDSAQARMIAAELEHRRRTTTGGVTAGTRGYEPGPAERRLAAYEQAEAEAEYRAAYDQARSDAWLRDYGERVTLRHVARPS